MNAQELKEVQAPHKQRYQDDPSSAQWKLCAEGRLDSTEICCRVESKFGSIPAGLHPATGGDGEAACSAEMLLEALVGCAGVTLKAVSTAFDCPLRDVSIRAEADLDFRGTLGIDRAAPVGLTAVRIEFCVRDQVEPSLLEKLITVTERYCVVLQTLKAGVSVESRCST